VSLVRSDATDGSRAETTGATRPTREAWLAREVPNVLVGLEASRGISGSTAAVARQLCDRGDHEAALSLVLGEALADPR
jgi:hypothetical protein